VALVPPLMKLFGNYLTTPGTLLTRAAWIRCNRPQPSSCRLDRQDLQELLPSSIMYGFGEPSPRQTFDVQLLMGNMPPLFQKSISNFVVKVSPLIGYFLMGLGQPLYRLLTASNTSFALKLLSIVTNLVTL